MRIFFYKITAILFVAVLFISCNGKSSGAKKDKTFSFVGLEFNIDAGPDNKKLPLYKDSSLDLYIDGNNSNAGHYEPIEYFDDYVGCEILSYNREHNSAYVNIKNSAGWVPLSHYAVIFDKEILLRSINAALEGNEDARLMLSFNFTYLTLDEALEKLRYIIDYVGVEHFKKLSPGNAEDLVILKAIARLIELSASGYDDITNPVHLLAEVANEDIWKFLDDSNSYPAGRKGFHDNYLSYFYNNSFFDSEGVSALMHAIKAKNLDTLKYFYENKIPDYYFSRLGKTNRDDKEKIYHLIQSTKDKNGKSLADYVAECDDEKIKRFMAVYDVYNDFSVKDCLEYLRGLEDWRNFQMLRVLYALVPYTTYTELDFSGNDSFVYLTNENGFMTYGENLNIRDAQGKSGKVIGKLPYGTKVAVLEKGSEKVTIDEISDFWYKVSANGLEGWCFGGYLANSVKYEDIKDVMGDDEKLNDLYALRRFFQEFKWLYQVDFENTKPTVIKETKLLTPKGDGATVKPLEDVEILAKIEGDAEDLWDYGNQDTNFSREYFYRYNYYLVRTQDYKTGIIGGSSLAHFEMGQSYNGPDVPVGGCESPYDFYVRLLFNPVSTDNYKTSYYAELFEVNHETKEIHALETGYTEGPGFEIGPVYLGDLNEGSPYFMELTAYRDFDMEKYNFFDEPTKVEPFYSFIFKTSLNWPEVSYNYYTVQRDTKVACNSLYKTSYDMEGKTEDNYYRYSYSYFESENRKVPECVLGEFELQQLDENGGHRCLGHRIEHFSLDSMTMKYESKRTEELDYAPEW